MKLTKRVFSFMVKAAFPDGERRLAWRRVSLISEDEHGMSGVAAAVYLDAATGEPLALIRDIFVCEPSWSPLFLHADNMYVLQVWLQTFGQFVLMATVYKAYWARMVNGRSQIESIL